MGELLAVIGVLTAFIAIGIGIGYLIWGKI